MSSAPSPSYADLLNIFKDVELTSEQDGAELATEQDARCIFVDADAQALPSCEDMLNIFADVDKVATVRGGTQAQAEARPTCQPSEEVECVDLEPASESKTLPQTLRRNISERCVGGQSTLENSVAKLPKPQRCTSYGELDQDHLPTYEYILCIFGDLEQSQSCPKESSRGQKENIFAKGEMSSLYIRPMKKFRDECISPRSPLDGGETPSSIISVDLVCK